MEILTSVEMKNADEYAIKTLGISSAQLMENAGKALFNACRARVGKNAEILILCGKGNNGADGLVAARLFYEGGYHTTVLLLTHTKPSPEWQAKFAAVTGTGITVMENMPDLSRFDLIVDALFGTGLNRPLTGKDARIIELANAANSLKAAMDIPSGLDASRAEIIGAAFIADITVTFCRPKIAHCLHPAKSYCGEVIIADIGIPDEAVSSNLYSLTDKLLPRLPVRKTGGHKGDYGHAVIIGGSVGKSGAAVMASLAALRTGVGLASCVLPRSCATAAMNRPELMSFFGRSESFFTKADAPDIIEFCKDKSVIAVGPGIGREPETAEFVRQIIEHTTAPIIIDADALCCLHENMAGRAILTPHIGEFARMAETNKEAVAKSRLEMSRKYAAENNVTLMLKSSETVITTQEGTQYISAYGTPALSKGGSGDILTGIAAALRAQNYTAEDTCKLSCYIQGKAARMAEKNRAAYAVTPIDIIEKIGVEDE